MIFSLLMILFTNIFHMMGWLMANFYHHDVWSMLMIMDFIMIHIISGFRILIYFIFWTNQTMRQTFHLLRCRLIDLISQVFWDVFYRFLPFKYFGNSIIFLQNLNILRTHQNLSICCVMRNNLYQSILLNPLLLVDFSRHL